MKQVTWASDKWWKLMWRKNAVQGKNVKKTEDLFTLNVCVNTSFDPQNRYHGFIIAHNRYHNCWHKRWCSAWTHLYLCLCQLIGRSHLSAILWKQTVFDAYSFIPRTGTMSNQTSLEKANIKCCAFLNIHTTFLFILTGQIVQSFQRLVWWPPNCFAYWWLYGA